MSIIEEKDYQKRSKGENQMKREEQLESMRKRITYYIKMHFEEGLSYAEIARKEGISRAAVSETMKKVNRFPDLKEKMEEHLNEEELTINFKPLINRQHKSYVTNLQVYQKAYPIYAYIVKNHATYQQAAKYFGECNTSSVQRAVQAISKVSPTAKERLQQIKKENFQNRRSYLGKNMLEVPYSPRAERVENHVNFILKYECGLKGAALCMGCTPSQIACDVQSACLSLDPEMREKAIKAQQIVSTFRNGGSRFNQKELVLRKMNKND